jgi:hypothetical protein
MKPDTKSKLGLGLILFGFFLPLGALAVPLLGLSDAISAGLIGFLLLGAPEIFMFFGAALAGKEGLHLAKEKIKKLFGLPPGRYPAGKRQYNLGLGIILLWFLLTLMATYIPGIFDIPIITNHVFLISLIVDGLFLFAIFGLGGDQMTQKIKNLFSWEEWTLPNEEEERNRDINL